MGDTVYHVYVAKNGTAKRSAREMRYAGKSHDKESAMKMAYSKLPTFEEFTWKDLTGEHFFDAPYGKASFLVSEGKYYAFVEEREEDQELYTISESASHRKIPIDEILERLDAAEKRIAELEAFIGRSDKRTTDLSEIVPKRPGFS